MNQTNPYRPTDKAVARAVDPADVIPTSSRILFFLGLFVPYLCYYAAEALLSLNFGVGFDGPIYVWVVYGSVLVGMSFLVLAIWPLNATVFERICLIFASFFAMVLLIIPIELLRYSIEVWLRNWF